MSTSMHIVTGYLIGALGGLFLARVLLIASCQ